MCCGVKDTGKLERNFSILSVTKLYRSIGQKLRRAGGSIDGRNLAGNLYTTHHL